MNVIDQIKRVMKENNISQKELADISGIERKNICNYLIGKNKNPTLKTLTKMCDPLGLEIVAKRKNEYDLVLRIRSHIKNETDVYTLTHSFGEYGMRKALEIIDSYLANEKCPIRRK